MPAKKTPRKKTSKKQTKKSVAKTTKKTTSKTSTVAAAPKKVVTFEGTKVKGVSTKPVAKPSAASETNTTSAQSANSSAGSLSDKIIAGFLAVLFIGGFAWFANFYLPYTILAEDETVRAEREAQEEAEQGPVPTDQATLDEEAQNLSFVDQTLRFQTNFGQINVELLDQAAPRNVENLVRLTARDYYDGLSFHRIVESEGFGVIQGGDPEGNGLGGESAFGVDVEDEIYIVEPQFETNEEGVSEITNTPVFRSNLYQDFNAETGRVTYPKGLMIMANSGPNTNGSQFFLTTTETTALSPSYTIVGRVQEESLNVLDQITTQVDPVDTEGVVVEDGTPNEPIVIENAELV